MEPATFVRKGCALVGGLALGLAATLAFARPVLGQSVTESNHAVCENGVIVARQTSQKRGAEEASGSVPRRSVTAAQVVAACTAEIESGRYSGADLANIYNDRGLGYRDGGSPAQAIADYNQALTLDPHSVSALVNRGTAFVDLGEYDRAMADVDRGLQLDPKNVMALSNRGLIYMDTQRYALARADFNRVLALDPRYGKDYGLRGFAEFMLGDRTRALPDFNRAIAINHRDAFTLGLRGKLYSDEGKYGHALADLNRALSLTSSDALTYEWRARVRYALGEYALAVADYGRAIHRSPKMLSAFDGRGYAYLNLGEDTLALADFSREIELAPKDIVGYEDRAEYELLQGRDDAALAAYGKALQIDPSAGYIYASRGDLYFDRGSYVPAARDLALAIARKDSSPYAVLWLHLSRMHLHQNDARELRANTARLKGTQWPIPVAALFSGKARPATTFAAASRASTGQAKHALCEAHFYVGEWYLGRQEIALAKKHLLIAAKSCPRTYTEYAGARAELLRLGVHASQP